MSDCIRRFFAPVDPGAPVVQRYGVGFAWQPNTPIANFNPVDLHDADPAGLYLGLENALINNPAPFFDDVASGLGIIFQPLTISAPFEQALSQLTGIVNLNMLQKLQGFLNYTNDCLNYIYAVNPAGQTLLNGLIGAANKTFVTPSAMGNCYTQAGSPLCLVADTVINDRFQVAANQLGMMQALTAAAGPQPNDPARFAWLADQVNQMALYSLFVASNAYQAQFLHANHLDVTGPNLDQWFQNGDNCVFALGYAVNAAVQGVLPFSFLKLAVIATLYGQSAAGAGGAATVMFDVKDYAHNHLGVPDENAARPPAIGLAHELTHAHHVTHGRQPGLDFGSWSTTLTELLCVGLGPFAAAPVCENVFRAAWPPAIVPPADVLNDRVVGQRDPYEPVPMGQTPADLRNQYGAI